MGRGDISCLVKEESRYPASTYSCKPTDKPTKKRGSSELTNAGFGLFTSGAQNRFLQFGPKAGKKSEPSFRVATKYWVEWL